MSFRIISITILIFFFYSLQANQVKDSTKKEMFNIAKYNPYSNVKVDQKDSLNLNEIMLYQNIREILKGLNEVSDITHFDRVEKYYFFEIKHFLEVLSSSETSKDDRELIALIFFLMSSDEKYLIGSVIKDRLGDQPTSEINMRVKIYYSILMYDNSTAIKYANLLLAKKPNILSLNILKAFYFTGLEKWEESRISFSKAIEIYPEYALAYAERAMCNKHLGSLDAAEIDFEKAIEYYPNFPTALNEQGRLYMEKKDGNNALKSFRNAIEADNKYIWAYNNAGRACKMLGNVDSALYYYNYALYLSPNYSSVIYNRAYLYYGMDSLVLAINDFTKYLELDEDFEVTIERGNAYLKNNQKDKALEDFKKAVKMEKEEGYPLARLADFYLNEDEFKKAIKYFNKAIKREPDYAQAIYHRGIAYFHLDNKEKALKDYNQAIQLKPDYYYCYVDRGRLHLLSNNIDAAIQDIRKALEIKDFLAYPYFLLGDCYISNKDYRHALPYYKKAIQINPKYTFAIFRKSYCLSKTKDYEGAVAGYTSYISLDSTNASAYGNLGWAYYCTDDYENCILFSEKAVQLDNTTVFAKLNIALANLCLGEQEKAKELYTLYSEDSSIKNSIIEGAILDLEDLVKKEFKAKEAQEMIDIMLKIHP